MYKVVAVTENGTVVMVKEERNKIAIVTDNGHYFLIDTDTIVTVHNYTKAPFVADPLTRVISYNTYDSPENR